MPAAKKTAPAAKNTKKKEYGASSITVLEGLEAVRKRPGHVYRLHRRAWSAPPRLGGRRQRRGRGDGRICDEGRRPDPRGRRRRGHRRRPRHPGRDARQRRPDRRRRDDPAARGRQVRRREQRLQRQRRPARRRRLRGERAVHPARGRHLPRRPRVVPVLRPRGARHPQAGRCHQEDRHDGPVLGGPGRLRNHQLRLRDRGPAAAGDGLPQQGPDHHARRRAGDTRRSGRRGRQRYGRSAEVRGGESGRGQGAAQGEAPHLPLPRRAGRLRQAHQPHQDADPAEHHRLRRQGRRPRGRGRDAVERRLLGVGAHLRQHHQHP